MHPDPLPPLPPAIAADPAAAPGVATAALADGDGPPRAARPDPRPAPPRRIAVVTRRADFLAANRGLRVARPGFVLLARANGTGAMRFGITVTKRIGNAVVRNRMKRRLRELLRAALPTLGLAGHDHILIGREGGVERDFALLAAELRAALARAAAGKGDAPRPHKPRGGKGAAGSGGNGAAPRPGRGKGPALPTGGGAPA